VNVDLCFVPATRGATEHKLPAVSGSSGRLVVEKPKGIEEEPSYPGQVFADERLDYEQAMLAFVEASQSASPPEASDNQTTDDLAAALKAQKQALRQAEEALRAERRTLRQQRKPEDQAWQARKAQRRQQKAVQAQLSLAERRAQDEIRWAIRQQRRESTGRRKQEDAAWRAQRNHLREQLAQLPLVTAWIAILVVTDNCTRQCLDLPLFLAGAKVTAEMVVEALRVLLPEELQFLISDRGTHFTAQVFKQLAHDADFMHVLIARHRPQSNGIAERFVRTLKEWLQDKTWQDDEELAALLAQFRTEYSDRPPQGLPIPGLSPNEFERRVWLF
jgi:transposase InsO family protein